MVLIHKFFAQLIFSSQTSKIKQTNWFLLLLLLTGELKLKYEKHGMYSKCFFYLLYIFIALALNTFALSCGFEFTRWKRFLEALASLSLIHIWAPHLNHTVFLCFCVLLIRKCCKISVENPFLMKNNRSHELLCWTRSLAESIDLSIQNRQTANIWHPTAAHMTNRKPAEQISPCLFCVNEFYLIWCLVGLSLQGHLLQRRTMRGH